MSDDKKVLEDLEEIADYHIEQKGVVAFRDEDHEIFVFTVDTLEFLLSKAKASPDKRAVVAIPRKGLKN